MRLMVTVVLSRFGTVAAGCGAGGCGVAGCGVAGCGVVATSSTGMGMNGRGTRFIDMGRMPAIAGVLCALGFLRGSTPLRNRINSGFGAGRAGAMFTTTSAERGAGCGVVATVSGLAGTGAGFGSGFGSGLGAGAIVGSGFGAGFGAGSLLTGT